VKHICIADYIESITNKTRSSLEFVSLISLFKHSLGSILTYILDFRLMENMKNIVRTIQYKLNYCSLDAKHKLIKHAINRFVVRRIISLNVPKSSFLDFVLLG